METHSASSELIFIARSDQERARHLLSLLLSLGRPARPPELSSLCKLFPASPELVHYLCSIPNSPIFLTKDLLVVPSPVAVTAFAKSVATSDFVNPISSSTSSSAQRLVMCFEKRKRLLSDFEFTPREKRRLTLFSRDEKKENRVPIEIQCTSPKVPLNVIDHFSWRINTNPLDMSKMVDDFIFAAPLSGKSGAGQLSCHRTEIKFIEGEMGTSFSMQRKVNKETMACEPNPEPALRISMLENLAVPKGAFKDGASFESRANCMAKFWIEEHNTSMMEAGNGDGKSTATKIRISEEERTKGSQEEERSLASGSNMGEMGNQFQPLHTILLDTAHGSGGMERVNRFDTMPYSEKEKTNWHVEPWALPPDSSLVVAQNKLSEPFAQMKTFHVDAASLRLKKIFKNLGHDKADETLKEKRQSKGAFKDGASFESRANCTAKFWLEDIEEHNTSMIEVGNGDRNSTATKIRISEEERTKGSQEEERSLASGSNMGEMGNQFQPLHTISLDTPHGSGGIERVNCFDTMPYSEKEKTNRHVEPRPLPPDSSLVVAQNKLSEPFSQMKTFHVDAASLRLKKIFKSLGHDKADETLKEKRQSKGDSKVIGMRQTLMKKNNSDMHTKQRKRSSTSISPKDRMEQKILPNFESYVVEEEEGSGGYGTVYRARRKNDGTTVAIKCPHANAHKHHVYNEQRMLERFGGKNFVIKYEGCFNNGDSDCFVLEHVEHDRPEVLKREIDVFQLQWYGYCMFKALASLHKQGVIHRDVKPGNFLFFRKANKGHLIDFNLAMDLHQKYGNAGKSKVGCDAHINPYKLSNAKSVQTKDWTLANPKSSETANLKRTKDKKSKIDIKNLRQKALAQTKTLNNDLGSWNVSKSQGADGSGITSAERMREPLPCQGRKELISLVQEARQSQNHVASSVLSPKRKRVVAPPQNVDSMLVYLTPMPVLSTGISVGGSLLMNKGNGKYKKEGPCVGTKGFRAPEVLFRSPFQGPKVDIWSAGVTLLYLMIGRTPFFGDPEQNIKDIAKLRGSEDLWEVAKLHNRESSFPEDLYKSESLPSVKLWDWCKMSTKRPDFLKEVPRSLLDLLEKCLTVNPRLRITADEALKHEFFAPCHEVLKKQRLHRQMLNQDSQNSALCSKSVHKPAKISQGKSLKLSVE